MVLPALLLLLAALASAIFAYGSQPVWARYPGGIDLILFSRQYQWPLATLSVLLCLIVVGMVVAGKRRAWWLIGLGPVLALFIHRFNQDPFRNFLVIDDPAFVPAERATFLSDEDYVVGVTFNGASYAYPYYALYRWPVVVQADHDKKLILLWSAFANRAVAYSVSREMRGRDLEIVSMPANALLVYNRKLGQFINGVTGLTPAREKPKDFLSELKAERVPWPVWQQRHPKTEVLVPPAGSETDKTGGTPLLPAFPQPDVGELDPQTRIALLPTTRPIALPADAIGIGPSNFSTAGESLMVFRDAATGAPRAFERRLDDLTPQFALNTDPRRKAAFMVDLDSNSGWSADGRAVEGLMAQGERKLKPVPIEEGFYWGVMKFWMPELVLVNPPAPATMPAAAVEEKPATRRITRPPVRRAKPRR